MKKRFLFVVLLATIVVTAFVFGKPTVAHAVTMGSYSNGVKWVLDNSGVLTISGNGEMVGSSPWDKAAVKKVVIEKGVTAISEKAFQKHSELTSVSIPVSVTQIHALSFEKCPKLEEFIISEFNPNYTVGADGAVYSKDMKELVVVPQALTGEFIVPDSVTHIGKRAFEDCSGLTGITFSENVIEIGELAFGSCTGLTKIEIPHGVSNLSTSVFNNCTGLTTVKIPESVLAIGVSAFFECKNLTNVEIPNSVTYIAQGAFEECSGLTSITIPDSVKEIGSAAFRACSSLQTVNIGNGVTYIGSWAFAYCPRLEILIIGKSVSGIGECAFNVSNRVEKVYYTGTKEQWDQIRIGNKNLPLTAGDVVYNFDGQLQEKPWSKYAIATAVCVVVIGVVAVVGRKRR